MAVVPPTATVCFIGSKFHLFSCLLFRRWNNVKLGERRLSSLNFVGLRQRRNLMCAVSKDAEKSFKQMVEVDRLIDKLRNTDDKEKDYEELAEILMGVVDHLVHKTNQSIESATDVLKAILKPAAEKDEEIPWPPRDPNALILMQKELNQREQEGQLDEGFLSEVNAQLRQAKEDGDKPGLEAMLQKVYQLYASRVLSKRSYAKKGNEVLKAEQFLETLIQASEAEWKAILIDGLKIGKGDISPEELNGVIKKRIERTLIRTEGGSYQQRVLIEYLKGIQAQAEDVVRVLQGRER